MGTIKDKNGMDLTEAEQIKKRWQEYREEFSKPVHEIKLEGEGFNPDSGEGLGARAAAKDISISDKQSQD